MPELKELLKDVVSRFKKANTSDNESTRKMEAVQKAAKRASQEVKEQKG